MEKDNPGGGAREKITAFFASPLHAPYAPPMRQAGDWFSAAGIVLFIVAVFALPWITISVEAFGATAYETSSGLFASPWAWSMVVVLLAILGGLWFVQTRGAVVLGAGIYCLLFNVIFYIGAWKKIKAIIGDVVNIARSVPIIGDLLGALVEQAARDMLNVKVGPGFYLLIPAGILLLVGGALRLAHRPRAAQRSAGETSAEGGR